MDISARSLAPSADLSTVVRISSEAVEPHRRVEFVSDEISRQLVGAQARALGGEQTSFDYRIVALDAQVRLTRGRVHGIEVERTSQHTRDGDDDFSIFVARNNGLRLGQCGQSLELARGDAVVITNTRSIDSVFSGADFLMIQLPRGALATLWERRGKDAPPLLIPAARAMLLRCYMAALLRQAELGMVPPVAARHLAELTNALVADVVLAEGRSPAARIALQASRVEAMRMVMARRYAQPDLTIRDVAAALNFSARTGQMAFSALQSSFSEELVAMRLERAMERFRSAPLARVLETALDVGFSDLSNFYRRFRDRFGMTPGDARCRSGS